MIRIILTTLCGLAIAAPAVAQLTLRDDVTLPVLENFRPLPAADEAFTAEIAAIVEATELDQMTAAADNPDNEDEWSSICVVDFSGDAPVVGGWRADNLVYPASSYKMYVLGEAIRQVVAGELSLDDTVTVDANNVRETEGLLSAGAEVSLSEILRLMIQDSSNTGANEAIDAVDRQRASALLRAIGCEGSDITRKFLPRDREDAGYAEVPGVQTSAMHMATFLWAVEQGAIGGGRGRGLIKGYLSMCQTDDTRFRKLLPPSATLYTKTGTWNTFTAQAALVEDGDLKYIICALVPYRSEVATPRMAELSKKVHELVAARHTEAGKP